MDNPGEILRLCRLCLVKDQVNIPIFEEQGDIRQIFLKISSCLPVTVSRDDQLPKKICDGCSNKLDLLYEFWNTSANAEKTLLSWLGQAGVKDADETISAVAQQIAKPAETQVKQENLEDGHAIISQQDNFGLQSFDEDTKDEAEPPPRKRARRTAAVKAQISIAPESDDDDDDMDNTEAMTKVEGESEESDGEDRDPSYGEVPGTSADDQAGPSGVGKDGVEAPAITTISLNATISGITFQCQDCNKKFDNLTKLKSHMEQNCKTTKQITSQTQNSWSCQKCFQIFATEAGLNTHTKSCKCELFVLEYKPKKPFKISAEDSNLYYFDSGRDVFICLKCLNEFANKEGISHHIKTEHSECKCQKCGQSFDCLVDLGYHSAEHDERPSLMTCPCCEFQTQIKVKLCYHIQTTHPSNSKPNTIKNESFFCKVCKKGFNYQKQLTYHENNHQHKADTDDSKPVVFSELKTIDLFANSKTFLCDACGKSFRSAKYLGNHKIVVHLNGNFLCEACGKNFKSSGALRKHIRGTHLGKPYKCNYCEKAFSHKFNMKTHELIHTRAKKYACKSCDKCFREPAQYDAHLLTHTEEKPYLCAECGKAFFTRKAMTIHYSNHNGEKPYHCRFCEKCFTKRDYLVMHERGHTGEKPYSCKQCHKCFAHATFLKKHLQVHSEERT